MTKLVQFGNSNIVLQKAVDYITLEELESLGRAVDTVFEKSNHSENDQWIRDRDKLLLSLLWITGARVSDVLNMVTKNIDFKDKSIRFIVKKRKDKKKLDGVYWHSISLDMETLTEIMAYMQTWGVKGFLFKSYRSVDKPMTRQAVFYLLKRLATTAGITKTIHPHMFRHGIAMHLQGKGSPVELIAYRLAHSGTDITLKTYARLDARQEKRMLDALNIDLRS